MKPLALAAALMWAASVVGAQPGPAAPPAPPPLPAAAATGLVLRPLLAIPEGDEDVSKLLANLAAVTLNLNDILNVLDAPEKRSPADVESARGLLPAQSRFADEYIPLADAALKRDLPRSRSYAMILHPRIDLVQDGSRDAGPRELATAQEQVLASQTTLLNLKIYAKASSADQTRFERSLADARKALADARSVQHETTVVKRVRQVEKE